MFLVLTGCSSTPEVSDKPKHLFILSGQSNMANLDLTKTFKPSLAKEFGPGQFIVIKEAERGLPISRWDQDYKLPNGKTPKRRGDMFERLAKQIDKAKKSHKIASVTVIWMQGERDAKLGLASVYEQSFKRIINRLKARLDRDDLNLVIGRINDFDMANKSYKHWTKIRDIQVKLAVELDNAFWLDTDDLNDRYSKKLQGIQNSFGMSGKGYHELGYRFAQASIALINQDHN